MDSSTGAEDGDPAATRVRRELARLGADDASAPPVPAQVTARIGSALRSASNGPTHSIDRPRLPRWRLVGLVVGIAAVVVGGIVGVSMLAREQPAPLVSTGPTASTITVSRPAIPLSAPQIAGLLTVTPDYGPLSDPARRAACLVALGYPPTTDVLGAQPLTVAGRPTVLLLLAGDNPDAVVALAVAPNCSAVHAGLIADTVVNRP